MLIGLTGPKQAGKDTVYGRASHIMAGVINVRRVSFADPLYESAAASLGVGVEQLRKWKNDDTVRVDVTTFDMKLGRRAVQSAQTVREYLQRYGTEAHREVFGEDFWVIQPRLAHEGHIVVVTDVRFDNEARAVRNAGGKVVRVVGPAGVEDSGDGHASEEGIREELVDAVLFNLYRDDGYRALDANVNRVLRLFLAEEGS